MPGPHAGPAIPSGTLDARGTIGHVEPDAFSTPEEAALAQWEQLPHALAHVVSVEYIDEDHAVVVTDTVPSHRMWNHCSRTAGGWVFESDHN